MLMRTTFKAIRPFPFKNTRNLKPEERGFKLSGYFLRDSIDEIRAIVIDVFVSCLKAADNWKAIFPLGFIFQVFQSLSLMMGFYIYSNVKTVCNVL